MTGEKLEEVLDHWFGYTSFKGLQKEIIECVLGGEDALVIMPTGGGKSLCFQLPALMSEGVGIVLSPLIALMQDQVDALVARGIPATFINSSLDKPERDQRLEDVVSGKHKLLYVTPERFRKDEFVQAMEKVPVSLLAVDEAHCISSWGHDFRPEYGRVGRIRELLDCPTTIALTATATRETQEDIRGRLGIDKARLFHTGIERPNLHVAVHPVFDDDERFERIVEVVGRLGGPGIIYNALIRNLHIIEERLQRMGHQPLVYHGKLSASERREMQKRFIESDNAIVVATNAFGMGVDKPDIRFILHCQVPGSIEQYYQEIGRAGRDGKKSLCELLYLSEDLLIQKQFIDWANPAPDFVRNLYNVMLSWGENLYARSIEDLRESLLLKNRMDGRAETILGIMRAEGIIGGSFEDGNLRLLRPMEDGEESRLIDPGKHRRDLERLQSLVAWCESTRCRQQVAHEYFDLDLSESCGNCDICLETDVWIEGMAPVSDADSQSGVGSGTTRGGPVDQDLKRGDWIMVNGRRPVLVKSVDVGRHGTTIAVESADDLDVRTYRLDRIRWKKLK